MVTLGHRPGSSWPAALAMLALGALLAVAGLSGGARGSGGPAAALAAAPVGTPYVVHPGVVLYPRPRLPGGGYRIFGHHRFLVAYYGTPQTGTMGVLGRSDPDTMNRRLVRAGRPFLRGGETLQPVYELIVTVADGSPGPDDDFSHDIPTSLVRTYLDAAHRHHALLLLDLQPGRSSFPEVARRWAWALRDPSVGLALDPEWRMGPHQVPGRVIGSVRAVEVNRTSAWLSDLVRRDRLPEKLFVLHQFRLDMIPDLGRVVHRPGLAMVQHADGFGTQAQKLATYRAITRPRQFHQGFKLFYRWDVHRFTPAQVRRIRPGIGFVSYQ